MDDTRKKAKELMKGACRVCPVCDGRVCAGEVPGMGGLGSAASFKANVRALADISLNMRLIHGATSPCTAVNRLGLDLALPVVAAPIGGMFNFNNAMAEADYARAVVSGSRAAGAIGCGGDGVPPEISGSAFAAIKEADGFGIPFIKPWEGAELHEKLDLALDSVSSGCRLVGMDIDAAGLVTLRKMGRPVGPKTPEELGAIAGRIHAAGCRFIVKGIMTVSDALLAVEAGADCIVVSNHGGRVLEYAPATALVLPAIAAAVKGRTVVMADSGVRSGADVLKMLALGADLVGIGRPVSLAAIGGGVEGVAAYFRRIQSELMQTMLLTGCPDIASISESVLYRP